MRTLSAPACLTETLVKSAITSGLKYAAGSPTSYSSCSHTVSTFTVPPVAPGLVMTKEPSAFISAIG